MSLTDALATRSDRRSRPPSRRQHQHKLISTLEHLESRCLLSGITSYAVNPAAVPYGITHDGTGAVWYADPQQGVITKVTLDASQNPVYASFAVNGSPTFITFSPADGDLYAVAGTNIDQFDTSGNLLNQWNVVSKSDVNSATQPLELTLGGDGAVWYTTQGAPHFDVATGDYVPNAYDNQIGRLDPASGATQLFNLTPTDAQTKGITSDGFGNVWFTMTPITFQSGNPNVNFIGSAHLGRIAVSSDQISYFNVPTSQGTLGDLRAAADGSIWYISADEVGDPRFATQPTPDLLGHAVYNPAAGGSVAVTEYQIPKLGDQTGVQPTSLTIDGTGTVWFSEFGDAKVSSFDPATGDFARYNVPGSTPGLLTASSSNVWITSPSVASGASLIRVDRNAVSSSILSSTPDIGAMAGQPATDPLVVFFSQTTGDFAYSIDYGNGQTAAGTVAHNTTGIYTIDANVTYAAAGTYATRITIADSAGETISLTGSAVVTVPVTTIPLTAQGINVSSQEDIALAPNAVGVDNVVVATFSGPVAVYSATINWGDHTTSAGQVVALGGGQFYVKLPTGQQKVYANPGSYNVSVVITSGTQTATATSVATITDTPLVASQHLVLQPLIGRIVLNIVATFTDDIDALTRSFTATINWGDGSTSTGLVVRIGNGSFVVLGLHSYRRSGNYNINTLIVNVAEHDSATATATVHV